MGMTAVALIVVSGIANTMFKLASVSALATTNYGLLIIAKIVLLSIMIVVAVINRFCLIPAIRKSAFGRHRTALIHNVVAEQILGTLVLAVAAVLGMLSPFG